MTSFRPTVVLLATVALGLTACGSSDDTAVDTRPASTAGPSTGSTSSSTASSDTGTAVSSTSASAPGSTVIPDNPTFGQIGKITREATKQAGTAHISMTSRGQSAEGDLAYIDGVEHSDTTVTSTLDASSKVVLRQRMIGSDGWQCDDKATGRWRVMTAQEKALAASIKSMADQQSSGPSQNAKLTIVGRNAPLDGLITTRLRGSVKSMGLPVQIEMWVDDQGLPRKQTTQIDVQGKKTTTQIIYTKYGEPVTINPAPVGKPCKD